MSALSEPRRPRLLARNRKLRHLQGLWLRNLCFAPTSRRAADDAALGSPNKLLEPGQLHSSRSSDSLCRASLRVDKRRAQQQQQQARKASLNLAQASPASRQKRLETLVDSAVGDVFFSLHAGPDAEPVYVSEVRQRAANFNFQFFTLANHAPAVSRSSSVTIRVWARRPGQATWVFVLEELVDLRQLNFIGTLADRCFPPNALIFHLQDGMYSLDFPSRVAEPKNALPVVTSTYNALMKLANLESSILDAVETQRQITAQINTILEQSQPNAAPAAAEEVALAEKYVATQRRANRLAERRRDDLRLSLGSRRAAMAEGRRVQTKTEQDMARERETLAASREAVGKTEGLIRGQRRRICLELSEIFPITPEPDAAPLSFRICNLPLPNSTYDAATARCISEDAISAALGLLALLARHLQLYLCHPLPYPLYAYGSRSFARDDISQLPDSPRRDFPLYLPRGGSSMGQWRFEYGWFLLNKDIEALCASQGLRVVDIRHSLPNTKYLLCVCSAGPHDVPERKKGGVRGLWAGRLGSRVAAPSTALVDAESSSSSFNGRAANNGHDGPLPEPAPITASAWHAALPFGEAEAKLTLRTRGLRENVAG